MLDLTALHKKIKGHHKAAVRTLHDTHRHAKKVLKKHGVPLHRLRHHAGRTLAVAGLTAASMAGPVFAAASPTPQEALVGPAPDTAFTQTYGPAKELIDTKAQMMTGLQGIMPAHVTDKLSAEQEQDALKYITDALELPASINLQADIRLNTVYGVMAAEQHIPRYPGDVAANHTSDVNWHLSKMTPKTAAWGYMAPSKAALTAADIEAEQWYIAAQTFLAPGWDQNVEKFYKAFHGAKMVVVNPLTGQNCVVRIEDAGPNPRLHRAFGGSPEVMDVLGLGAGPRKGPVFAFFLDDPDDQIRLGPWKGGQ